MVRYLKVVGGVDRVRPQVGTPSAWGTAEHRVRARANPHASLSLPESLSLCLSHTLTQNPHLDLVAQVFDASLDLSLDLRGGGLLTSHGRLELLLQLSDARLKLADLALTLAHVCASERERKIGKEGGW